MSETHQSLPVAAAVFAGATVLVGLPVTVLTLMLFDVILGVADSIGVAGVGAAVTLPVLLLSVLAGLQAAYETTALRLHGMGALHRGSRLTVLVRHSLLSLYVLAFLTAPDAVRSVRGTGFRETPGGRPRCVACPHCTVGRPLVCPRVRRQLLG
jgi:hypothetical protein